MLHVLCTQAIWRRARQASVRCGRRQQGGRRIVDDTIKLMRCAQAGDRAGRRRPRATYACLRGQSSHISGLSQCGQGSGMGPLVPRPRSGSRTLQCANLGAVRSFCAICNENVP